MIFFEYEQVVKIHGILISKTGGMDGVRDEKLLDSAIKAPAYNIQHNSDLWEKNLEKGKKYLKPGKTVSTVQTGKSVI